jgi:glycine/D-amino acid oxidase-like deaminating enzyme
MERMRILDPAPDQGAIKLMHARAVQLVPELRQSTPAGTWAGYIDATPDGVPGIGGIEQVPGFILAAGFSGHGFGIGPGSGHLIADLITGAEPIVDPKPYDPKRFEASAWGKVAEF